MKFMSYRRWFFTLSSVLLVSSALALAVFGLRLGVDFTGGAVLEVVSPIDLVAQTAPLQAAIGETFSIASIQPVGESSFSIRGSELTQEEAEAVMAVILERSPEASLVRFETLGPSISAELVQKTLAAITLVSGVIALYVWYQFRSLKFGISAIMAMLHDSFILLGAFSILGHFFGAQVDVLFVTALLTTLSFSIHDTIVVYDRIRELQTTHPRLDSESRIDLAIGETLSRSINNSLTIIFPLISLALISGPGLRWFAIALLIGAVAGTYSSTFTAAPLLLVWERLFRNKTSRLFQ